MSVKYRGAGADPGIEVDPVAFPALTTEVSARQAAISALTARMDAFEAAPSVYLDARAEWGVVAGTGADQATHLQNAFNGARDAGPGARLVLPPGMILTAGTVVYDQFVDICGHGNGATILKLADNSNVDVLRSKDWATYAGTDLGGGPKKFALRNFRIDGNKAHNTAGNGLLICGFDYVLEDVEVGFCPELGIVSDWSEYDPTFANPANTYWPNNYVYGQMEARWRNVDAHHNTLGGIRFNGPHDSKHLRVVAYKNGVDDPNAAQTGTVGIDIGTRSDGTRAVGQNGGASLWALCHSWGVQQAYAWRLSSKHIHLLECEGEGGKLAQVKIDDSSAKINGGRFFRGDNRASDIAFHVGDTAKGYKPQLANIRSEISKGRVFFDNDGGHGHYDLYAYNAWANYSSTTSAQVTVPSSGSITIPVVSTYGMPSAGGVRAGGWDFNYASTDGTHFLFCTPGVPTPPPAGTVIASGAAVVSGMGDTTAPEYLFTGTQSVDNSNRLLAQVEGGGKLIDPATVRAFEERFVSRREALTKPRVAQLRKGALMESMAVSQVTANSTSVLTSNALGLQELGVVSKGEVISTIRLLAGQDSAPTALTRTWFSLYSYDLALSLWSLLAVTTDESTWTASSQPGTVPYVLGLKSLPIDKTIQGGAFVSASSWEAPGDLLLFVGAVVGASTMPSLACITSTLYATGVEPMHRATGPTSLTGPTSAPLTLTPNTVAVSGNVNPASRPFYCSVS